MTQLVERSLPTIEVRGLNPVIGKFYIVRLLKTNCIEMTKIKKNEALNDPFYKKHFCLAILPTYASLVIGRKCDQKKIVKCL